MAEHSDCDDTASVIADGSYLSEDASTSTEAQDDGASVNLEYIKDLMLVCTKICGLCNQKSDELNPLLQGPYRRSIKIPTWPWLHGTLYAPVGKCCRICPYVFVLGGFATSYPSTDAVKAAMKDEKEHPTLRLPV